MNIPITKLSFTKEDESTIINTIRSGWITQGPKVAQFEKAVAEYIGVKYAIAVTSCTTALHLALIAEGIIPGDEVITTSYTFIATANAIVYCGAKPVFVDIDINTYNIDPNKIERAITKKTKAILVVHQVGLPAEMDKINLIAKKYNLKVIEDAACALGSEYKGKKIGTISNLSCFSFHPKKVITTGEGGMVTTNNQRFALLLRVLRNHGASVSDLTRHHAEKTTCESYKLLGYNYRMPDISATIGITQMKRLECLLDKRHRLAEYYNLRLKSIACLVLPSYPKYHRHSYQSYILRLNDAPIGRDKLIRKLWEEKGIMARRIMAVHKEPYYHLKYPARHLPHTEQALRNSFLLPLYPSLKADEQEYVIKSLKDLLG